MRRSLSGKPPPKRRPASGGSAPPRPDLPAERAQLPGSVYRELKRTARTGELEDVAKAVGAASEAVELGEVERAVTLLEWAKHKAPRSVAIREGLGVAYYLTEDYEGAQRELQAYRRMSGRADQNHLLADTARAVGRPERVPELVEEMEAAHEARQVPLDRLVELLIVQAGMWADEGRHVEALALLERAPLPEGGVSVPHGRVWYAAGDIAERAGEVEQARDYFEAAMLVDDDFMDAESRLEDL